MNSGTEDQAPDASTELNQRLHRLDFRCGRDTVDVRSDTRRLHRCSGLFSGLYEALWRFFYSLLKMCCTVFSFLFILTLYRTLDSVQVSDVQVW